LLSFSSACAEPISSLNAECCQFFVPSTERLSGVRNRDRTQITASIISKGVIVFFMNRYSIVGFSTIGSDARRSALKQTSGH
jgi:hypothetical protein